MKKITAGEIMVPLEMYPHVNHKATISEVLDTMEHWQIDHQGRKSLPRTVLVFDDIHQLVGYVRRRNILRALEPRFLSETSMRYRQGEISMAPDPNLAEILYEKIVHRIKERSRAPIIEVMEPVVMWINYEDHLAKAILEIVTHDVSFLPVVQNKRVVGVIRTVDVLTAIRGLLVESEANGK